MEIKLVSFHKDCLALEVDAQAQKRSQYSSSRDKGIDKWHYDGKCKQHAGAQRSPSPVQVADGERRMEKSNVVCQGDWLCCGEQVTCTESDVIRL